MVICLSKLQETVKDREAWHAAVLGDTKSQELNSNRNSELFAMGFALIFQNFGKSFKLRAMSDKYSYIPVIC